MGNLTEPQRHILKKICSIFIEAERPNAIRSASQHIDIQSITRDLKFNDGQLIITRFALKTNE